MTKAEYLVCASVYVVWWTWIFLDLFTSWDHHPSQRRKIGDFSILKSSPTKTPGLRPISLLIYLFWQFLPSPSVLHRIFWTLYILLIIFGPYKGLVKQFSTSTEVVIDFITTVFSCTGSPTWYAFTFMCVAILLKSRHILSQLCWQSLFRNIVASCICISNTCESSLRNQGNSRKVEDKLI